MSYGAGAALQAAVYHQLRGDEALGALVGDAIFDAMPVEAPSGVFVSLGPEDAVGRGDVTARGARHDLIVTVASGADEGAGFGVVKQAAVAVADALEDADLDLSRGHLVAMQFLRAKARKVENGVARQVDLTFRARIDFG
ncbi:DUF3168 domain-containing protein [Paracoccus sp. 1_MG-2023]|uniref:DUF3168 domain-containing protein n=1 Tax=unclassified Paracoccus (in: a-proteobacteria) TaxID=2688777 RepID=UPI001C090EDA|nr:MULTISPECIES: DUF3168 domain-containing protein [unclassified Paracoccus (in: a-proteobacteria)]MBU2958632.1 DUF3168 domain-containing protein [Paracoccus sp. C2R09]MDO6667625.1 DUF3168 domain-containing protein [Paracoccus sp. 1_MG-2023]